VIAGVARPRPYPTAIAVAGLLVLFVEVTVSPLALVRALVLVSIMSAAVTIVATAITGDADLGALVSLVVALAFLGGRRPEVLVLAVLALTCLLVIWRLRRERTSVRWPFVTRVLTILATVLLLAVAIKAAQDGRLPELANDLVDETMLASLADPARAAGLGSTATPDIFVVLADGYLRPDKQQTFLGRDGSDFVEALQARGFDVVAGSRSNYTYTHLSLPSMFDMTYVLRAGEHDHGFEPRHVIYHSATFAALREHGYEIITVAPGWEGVTLRGGDRFIDTGQPTDFELTYLRSTVFGPLMDAVDPTLWPRLHRQRVGAILEAVRREVERVPDRPRFVFVHLPIPHSPFVFGPEGEPRDPPLGLQHYVALGGLAGRQAFLRDYAEQLRFTDTVLVSTIDTILAGSAEPPVVLMISDHGSRSAVELGLDVADRDDEATANLVALRTPGDSDPLPDRMTLVNVMSTILDRYLGTDHGPLEDVVLVREADGRLVEAQLSGP
jgi:hypothetical protein